jgi:predicted Zn finger-like uncharacterized protein
MKIQCARCMTRYHLDTDRLPDCPGLQVKCKKCSNVISIDFAATRPEPSTAWRRLLPENALYGESLQKEVSEHFSKLYPMPHVMLKARRLLSDPETDFRQVSNLLKTDQALASRVLKAANSPYFGFTGRVSSIRHASTLLGTNMLIQIIDMVSSSKVLGATMKGYEIDSGAMWRHSITVAVGSDMIAKKVAAKYSGEAFFAGLLHDAGKILLDPYILERRAAFSKLTQTAERPIHDIEKAILGLDHGVMGAELCTHWALPEMVADAIRWHHAPSGSQANILAYVIHAADAITKGLNATTFSFDIGIVEDKALQFLRLGQKEIEKIAYQTMEAVETLEDDTY